jgi:hypothetical protein
MKCKMIKRGFGGNAPNKLRPGLKVRVASMLATRAVGTAKSLSNINDEADGAVRGHRVLRNHVSALLLLVDSKANHLVQAARYALDEI